MTSTFMLETMKFLTNSSIDERNINMKIIAKEIWNDPIYRGVVSNVWNRTNTTGYEPYLLIGITLCFDNYSFNHSVTGGFDVSTHTYIWDRISLIKIKLKDTKYGDELKILSGGRSLNGYKQTFALDSDKYVYESENSNYINNCNDIPYSIIDFPRLFRDKEDLILCLTILNDLS